MKIFKNVERLTDCIVNTHISPTQILPHLFPRTQSSFLNKVNLWYLQDFQVFSEATSLL